MTFQVGDSYVFSEVVIKKILNYMASDMSNIYPKMCQCPY